MADEEQEEEEEEEGDPDATIYYGNSEEPEFISSRTGESEDGNFKAKFV